MAEQWLSIVEYARSYQVSDMTVRRRIKTGKLHAVLQEGKYFIPVPVGGMGPSGATAGGSPGPGRANAHDSSPHPRQPNDITVIKGHPAAHRTYGQAAVSANAQPNVAAPYEVRQKAPAAQSVSPRHYPTPPQLQRNPSEPKASSRFDADPSGEDSEGSSIPASLRRPLLTQEASLVDTRSLLAFCEASLRKAAENERRTVEKFKSKLETVEAMLVNRDMEIKALRQQVEDLQLLCKILERKKI